MNEESWPRLVDAVFKTVKVTFGKMPPFPDDGKGRNEYLVSHLTPFDLWFRSELAWKNKGRIDPNLRKLFDAIGGTEDLVKEVWQRLFSTPEGRKMMTDAFSDSLTQTAELEVEATCGSYEMNKTIRFNPCAPDGH